MKNRHNYIIAALLLFISLTIQAQTIVYVDGAATGADNGTSWVNAYKNLQTAIDAAAVNAPAQVWVKAGTYKPTKSTDRTLAFELLNNVEIFGGFNGTESLLTQRNITANKTYLSGDIGVQNDNSDNTYAIIYAGNSVLNASTIDGFYIHGASTTGAGSYSVSGAVAIFGTANKLTVRNCTIYDNECLFGSAITTIWSSNGSSIFELQNSTIHTNGNAGVTNAVWSTKPIEIVNTLFYDNSGGTAIYRQIGAFTLINSTFYNNTGAIYLQYNSTNITSEIYNSIFWNNPGTDITVEVNAIPSLTATNNIVQGGFSNGTNIIDQDPLFVNPSLLDFSLEPCSPGVNAGNNNFLPSGITTDITGGARTFDTTVDLGATEYQNISISISALEVVDADCFGSANGQISANASGQGTLQYSIDGINFSTSPIISGLAANTYNFQIKDGNNCIKETQVTVNQPTQIIINTTNQDVTCNGGLDGKITVNATGGSGNFEYKLNSGNYQSSNVFDALSAGNYTVNVKDISSTNCIVTSGTIPISQPGSITATTTVTDAQCFGSTDGEFTVSASGGTAPLYYTIEGLSSNYLTSPVFTGLAAGNYTLTVIDSKLCYKEYPVTINQPTALVVSTTQSDILCNGAMTGAINATVTGGTAPYEYSLDGTNFQASTNFAGLDGGSYDVTVKDAHNCTATQNITIAEPDAMVLTTTVSDISCNGLVDGSIGVSASGGTSAYTFSMDGVNFSAVTSFDNLAAGNYTITLKDANGCEITEQVTITEPAVIAASVSKTDVTCNGADDGIISFTTSGGTGTVEASIDGTNFQTGDFTGLAPANYTVTFKDENNCTVFINTTITEPTAISTSVATTDLTCAGSQSGKIVVTASGSTAPLEYSIDGANFQSSATFSSLDGGSYTITTQDANSCTTTDNVTLTEPDALVLTTTVSDISCNGLVDGSIGVSASGGTSAYTFSMDGVNFSAVTSFDNLAAGDYTITLKDANGCEITEQVTITEPAVIVASVSKTDVTCNGADDGIISFTTSGGTGTLEASIDGTNFQTGDFTGLAPNNYTITFKDANGCTLTNMETINEPIALSATLTVTDLTCPPGVVSGRISIVAAGGTAPYEYSMDGTNFQTAPIFSLAEGGNYEITIRDANGCSIIENATVNQPDAFAFNTVLADIACNGENDGSISVTASGGTSPYEYSIDGTNFSTTGDYTGLAAGSYTIQLMDANACSYTEDFTIIEPDELTINASFNGTNVDLTAIGGTSPYTYSSDGTNFQSEASFTLPNGNYTFTVQDDNGCETSTTEQLLVTGIELGENINSIEMYPNPALNSINLSNIEKIKRIEIRSVSGKLVYEAELRGSTSSIDISYFKGGPYLLLLTKANGEVLRKRFIKN